MRKIRLVFASLAVLTLATEIALRFGVGLGDPPLARLDPATEYELVPGARYRRWGNTITVNAAGMRTRDHSAFPRETERRVLLIGDSVIYGNHFLDQSETIAAALEQKLAGVANLAGCTFLALPMAVSSWGPENQAAFLARERTFGSEAAAIVLSAHDLYDVPEHRPDLLPYRLTGSRTAIGDALEIVWERLWPPQPPHNRLPLEARARRSLVALDAMRTQLIAAGIQPVIVYHPTQPERTGKVAKTERDRFRDWAETRGLQFVDLGAEITAQGGYRDAIHPDPAGADRIASVLADKLGAGLRGCTAQASTDTDLTQAGNASVN
jgi:hypothetical protein